MLETIIITVGITVGALFIACALVIDRQTRRLRHRMDVLEGRRWLLEKILDRSQFIPTHVAIEGGYRPHDTPSPNLSHHEDAQ